jgi:DNA-binding transcriptional ArsR family regulator
LFNLKLQILASGTLRQKIIRFLIENLEEGVVRMTMNREMFADFLNVARPSLSRELMKMEEEGLIITNGKLIKIPDPNILDEGL